MTHYFLSTVEGLYFLTLKYKNQPAILFLVMDFNAKKSLGPCLLLQTVTRAFQFLMYGYCMTLLLTESTLQSTAKM
jgi:hypothetical protein